METYDFVVVGSGASGLTAALLLAMSGKKTLLLEKEPRLGGSLSRFRRQGVPFDTGFHFTGGLADGGLLADMLKILGIRDRITPAFLPKEDATRFIFEKDDLSFSLPYGIKQTESRLLEYFPGEKAGITEYLKRVRSVCDRTASMSLSHTITVTEWLDEDFISLQEVLDELIGNAHLQTLLSGFSMCYGVRPKEISFANHARICLFLYESVARVEGGGQAFVQAFQEKLDELGVHTLCDRRIESCADLRDRHAHRFVLNSGEEIAFEKCILTIHPKEILKILPGKLLSPAFLSRVGDFESSIGFFGIFGATERPSAKEDYSRSIVSLFPSTDVNEMLSPALERDSALVILQSPEEVDGRACYAVSALEPSAFENVAQWKNSRRGRRPQSYLDYKRERADRILERMDSVIPRSKFRLLDTASVLTFRDYLHTPDGSAYGVKQKMGQFNLIGKLPVRNMYAAGQSSILPGVLGAMMSSFLVIRSVLGKESFGRFFQ
jgi:all-trans-retinol 13,14-reductase